MGVEFAPASAQRDALVRAHLADAAGAADCAQLVVHLAEPLHRRPLHESLQHVVTAHPALRTTFGFAADYTPWARVRAQTILQFAWHDFSAYPVLDAQLFCNSVLTEDRRTAFRLDESLVRFTLVRLAEAETRFVCSYHPALLPGFCNAPLLADIFTSYDRLIHGLPPPAPQRILRPSVIKPPDRLQEAPWVGEPAAPPLCEARVRSVTGTGSVQATWDPATVRRLRGQCETLDLPEPVFLEAAWATTLRGLTGDPQASCLCLAGGEFGAPDGDLLATWTGPRLSATPIRGGREVATWLTEIAQSRLRPQPTGATASRYDVTIDFEAQDLNAQIRALGADWGPARHAEHSAALTSALHIRITAHPEFSVRMDHSRARYRRCAVERIHHYLEQAAAGLLDELDTPGRPSSLLAPAERARVIHDWNQTQDDFPDHLPLHGAFCQQARRAPDQVALICSDAHMTYGALDLRSDEVAGGLLSQGVRPGQFIAVCLPRGLDLVVALLGVLKAGCAYVPLDPEYPEEYKRHILVKSQSPWVLTQELSRGTIPSGIDTLTLEGLGPAPHPLPLPPIPTSGPCYALFTSGSSGPPKGVVLSHRAVVNTIDAINERFEVGPRDRLLFVTSVCFDLSVYDLFGGLGAGATVHIARDEELRDPQALADHLRSGQITIWNSAPAAFECLMPGLTSRPPAPGLRLVLLSGDWIALKLPGKIADLFPEAQVVALGGATECAIWSNYHVVHGVDPLWPSIPYGRPLRNARYYILNEDRQPVPWGAPGELYIAGTCVAEGYLGEPELTQRYFLTDPFFEGRMYRTGDRARHHEDGTIELLGRADRQVKVRGYRVELGAIERQLMDHEAVQRCVVVARRGADAQAALCAFVQGAKELDAEALARYLGGRLPNYMVPGRFEFVDHWPLTSNSKIDRAALQSRAPSRATVGAPARDEAELRMLTHWKDVLGSQDLGAQDDFYDLGGHSLLAARLVSRINEAFCVELPITSLLQHRTPRELLQQVSAWSPDSRSTQGWLRPLSRSGKRPPLLVFPGVGGHVFTFRRLALNLGPDQPVYGFDAVGSDGRRAPLFAVPDIAKVYMEELAREDLQGPFVLAGYSFGGLVAFELARQLFEAGVQVQRVVLLDTFAPQWPPKRPLPQRIVHHARTMPRQRYEGRRYVSERVLNLQHRLLRMVNRHDTLAPQLPDEVSPERRAELQDLWAASDTARRRYLPRGPLPHGLDLVTAESRQQWPATDMSDPELGWSRWTEQGVRVWPTQGQHLTMFDEAHLPSLVRILRDIIQ